MVWQKVKGNKDFQELLKAIPDGATIIEDTSFKGVPKKKQDTNIFWGARNPDRKDFENKVKNIASAKDNQERVNDFVQYGIYKGCNVMGKILMICRKCLIEGTEPDFDYELLRSKNIYLLGKLVDFGKKEEKPQYRNDILLGVIAGDMIGRPYERKKDAIKTTEFPLFERRCKYTDDSVLTIAVADWLINDKNLTWEVLADRFVHYGTRYRIKGQVFF